MIRIVEFLKKKSFQEFFNSFLTNNSNIFDPWVDFFQFEIISKQLKPKVK